MKRRVSKILIGGLGSVALVLVALVVVAEVRGAPTFRAPYPAIRASSDPTVVARGEYLVRGPGHCVECHGDPRTPLDAGAALSGGFALRLPVGTWFVPNLTPDPETGIGRRTDSELARVLRHDVRADGHAALPFMSFARLSDEDLTAVVSYLRAQPPVRNVVPSPRPNVLGRVVLAFVLEPRRLTAPAPRRSPEGLTLARGEYLVRSVAGCVTCHTRFDHHTGERIGPELAGGLEMGSRDGSERSHTPPSLRPDPTTRRVTGRSEEAFVARLRVAGGPPGTPMPWHAIARTHEDDLRAIYRYLQSLPPSGEL